MELSEKLKGEETFIIAEAGINHGGDVKNAMAMVNAAHLSGADAVKFQVFEPDEICSRNSEYYEVFEKVELDDDEWRSIAYLAKELGIVFFGSAFGLRSADLLDELESPIFKIASGDITYLSLIRYIASKGKPVIISTGMSTIGEIEEVLNCVKGVGNDDAILLHCVSCYPPKPAQINLMAIPLLKEVFRVPVGFSDHSVGIEIPIAAVALGATVIEKHFTLDKSLKGPDYEVSLEPEEFRVMVQSIRNVEKALGRREKKVTGEEKVIRESARRSITASTAISKGETITSDKVRIVRPLGGIEPKLIDIVLGRSAKRDIARDEQITWDMI